MIDGRIRRADIVGSGVLEPRRGERQAAEPHHQRRGGGAAGRRDVGVRRIAEPAIGPLDDQAGGMVRIGEKGPVDEGGVHLRLEAEFEERARMAVSIGVRRGSAGRAGGGQEGEKREKARRHPNRPGA